MVAKVTKEDNIFNIRLRLTQVSRYEAFPSFMFIFSSLGY